MAGAFATSDWQRVEAETAAIIAARPAEYDPATRQNLVELMHVLRTTNRPAPELAAGYWPTFCVTWDAAGSRNLEIEVFGDRYEVYRFFDGKTDIRYEYHKPGEHMSAALMSELPVPA